MPPPQSLSGKRGLTLQQPKAERCRASRAPSVVSFVTGTSREAQLSEKSAWAGTPACTKLRRRLTQSMRGTSPTKTWHSVEGYLRGRLSREYKGAGKASGHVTPRATVIPGNDPVPTQTPIPLQTHQKNRPPHEILYLTSLVRYWCAMMVLVIPAGCADSTPSIHPYPSD